MEPAIPRESEGEFEFDDRALARNEPASRAALAIAIDCTVCSHFTVYYGHRATLAGYEPLLYLSLSLSLSLARSFFYSFSGHLLVIAAFIMPSMKAVR